MTGESSIPEHQITRAELEYLYVESGLKFTPTLFYLPLKHPLLKLMPPEKVHANTYIQDESEIHFLKSHLLPLLP